MQSVTITVKAKRPGKEWDVLWQNEGVTLTKLGSIVFNEDAARDDRWVPYRADSTYPSTWCGAKHKAVQFVTTDLLWAFAEVEVRWGKKAWTLSRVPGGDYGPRTSSDAQRVFNEHWRKAQ